MTKQDFALSVNALSEAYRKEITKPMLKVWYMYFSEISKDDLVRAILVYIKNNRFFPTVAELLDLIGTGGNKHPHPEQAWFNFTDKNEETDPLVRRAFKIAKVDSYKAGNASSDTVYRYMKPQVMKIYQQLLAEENKEEDQKFVKKICENNLLGIE